MTATQPPKKKKSWGKRILIGIDIFIGILFVIGLIGSQLDKNDEVKTGATQTAALDNTAPTESNDVPAYQKIGDQIEVGNFTCKVNSAKFAKTVGNEFMKKTADGIFLLADVTLRNKDNEEHTLNNSFFKLTDETGIAFSSSTDGEGALEMSGQQTLFLKQCNPHISKSGLLIFEVPYKKVYDLHLSGGFWMVKQQL